MDVIAKQQDDNIYIEVINYSMDLGRVVNLDNDYVGPTHSISSILSRGYWEEYDKPIEMDIK